MAIQASSNESRGRSLLTSRPPPSPSSHIIQLRPEDARRTRRTFNGRSLFMPSSRNVVLALPGGRTYSQSSPSRSSRSRSMASSERSDTLSEQDRPSSPAITTTASDLEEDSRDSVASSFMSEILVSVGDSTQTPEERRAQERERKQRQAGRWLSEVLPSLRRPYLRLLRVSEGLRSSDRSVVVHCSCGGSTGHTLSVICVYFDREFCYSSIMCSFTQALSRRPGNCADQVVQMQLCRSATGSTRAVSLCTSRTFVSRRHLAVAIYVCALRTIATKHNLFL